MDYARHQRDPTRHAIGIGFVVLVHALVIWALIAGLGRTVVDVIKKPLNGDDHRGDQGAAAASAAAEEDRSGSEGPGAGPALCPAAGRPGADACRAGYRFRDGDSAAGAGGNRAAGCGAAGSSQTGHPARYRPNFARLA